MLLGQSPFRGDDEDEIFDAILEDEPLYPITMPRDAVSILQKVECFHNLLSITLMVISQLLTRDPTRRLGSGKADAEEIKRHPFFKDVSFDDVLNKRIPPPYFPTIVSPMFQVQRSHVDLVCRMGVRTPVTSMKSLQRSNRH